jgi:hypothetical protein
VYEAFQPFWKMEIIDAVGSSNQSDAFMTKLILDLSLTTPARAMFIIV